MTFAELQDLMQGDLNNPPSRKEAVYNAFMAGEQRFDGHVFVGVSSTRIYCRPMCHARTPKPENCTFFHSAAEAEAAGYRPCLQCRPELAPGPSRVAVRQGLAQRCAALVASGAAAAPEPLARSLGCTEEELQEEFRAHWGVSLAQFAAAQKRGLAKALLTDTRLPVEEVARLAGFEGEEDLAASLKQAYRLQPGQLRRKKLAPAPEGGQCFYTAYRRPFSFSTLLAFLRFRQLEGVEVVDDVSYARTVRLEHAGRTYTGAIRVTDDEKHARLRVWVSDSLLPALSQVMARVACLFDTGCDPAAVHEGLATLDQAVPGAAVEGTRVPGAFSPFEITVRAVLGQQISVVAANKLAARIAQRYGMPVQTGIPGLSLLFPTAQDFLQMSPVEDALGQLGVVKVRSHSIQELARMFAGGQLRFDAGACVEEQMERLLAVRGIGPWTANYIAMRAMGHPDAFLETDAGIKHALPDFTPKERLEMARAWQPWRSYANVSLWNSLSAT